MAKLDGRDVLVSLRDAGALLADYEDVQFPAEEIQKAVEELADAAKLTLYSPWTNLPTHDRSGARISSEQLNRLTGLLG
jgi:hypothetical protein